MITVEKIQIYETFGGLYDGLALIGDQHQKQLFENNDDWYFLDGFYQDILLMNGKMASTDYSKSALSKMQERCDPDGYCMLLDKIMPS